EEAARRPSTAFEVRSALLGERRQSLLRVLRREGEVERAPLVLETELQRRLVGAIHCFLGEPGCNRPLRRDVVRDTLRFFEPLFTRDDARDETGGERLFGGEQPAAQDHVHRRRLADGTREALRSARAGDDPQRRLRLAETRRLRR